MARGLEPIQPPKLLVHARRSYISHNQHQHQLLHQNVLWKGHLQLITVGAQLATIHFKSQSSWLLCLGIYWGPGTNRNWFQNNSRPWRTLQRPFQWRSCTTQLKMCGNAPRPESRLPVAISSISFSQCKNADHQLFNSIFGITVQWKLSEIFCFLRLQLVCKTLYASHRAGRGDKD